MTTDKRVTTFVCSNGHMWAAVGPQSKCPYCIKGVPCTGTPRQYRSN